MAPTSSSPSPDSSSSPLPDVQSSALPPEPPLDGRKQKRAKLPKEATEHLRDWLYRHANHPYPSEEEKKQMCTATGLTMCQVSNWMINVSLFPQSGPMRPDPDLYRLVAASLRLCNAQKMSLHRRTLNQTTSLFYHPMPSIPRSSTVYRLYRWMTSISSFQLPLSSHCLRPSLASTSTRTLRCPIQRSRWSLT